MSDLKGKKVAVLVETEYIPFELDYYRDFFEKQGAQVDFLTYLWGNPDRVIVSDVDSPDKEVQSMTVTKEIADANPNDYASVKYINIVAKNAFRSVFYTSCQFCVAFCRILGYFKLNIGVYG